LVGVVATAGVVVTVGLVVTMLQRSSVQHRIVVIV